MTELSDSLHVAAFVGTDHHPFNRLVEAVDMWFRDAQKTDANITCLVQYGTSKPPGVADGVAFLDRAGIERQLGKADIVLSHGGPSTIVEALRTGKIPLVMPRDPERGEHIDGHQQRFTAHMARRKLIKVIQNENDLNAAVEYVLEHRDGDIRSDIDLPNPSASAMKLAVLVDQLIENRNSKGRKSRNPSQSGWL